MASGWESKSVEEQMASSQQATPALEGRMYANEEARRAAEHARSQRQREKQTLFMQRENILSQRTSNAARRAALESALQQIEARIASLE
jgi:hypothetical protein